MGQEMFFRKIPEDMRPWECNVNGVKYVYPAGTEQNVPAEVAALIDVYWEKQEVDHPETGISFNDLRDRPFGEIAEVLFDQRVEFANEGAQIPQLLPFSVGDSVKVTWNGAEYECIAFDGSAIGEAGSAAVGNLPSVTGVDTGEPFAIATVPVAGFTVVFSLEEITEASVKIEGTVVKPLDPKFIPAGVGGGVVIVQDSAMASGIAVVDSGATATMNAAEIAEAIFAGKTVYFLEPNNGTLLPFVYGYRFGDLASGVMTAAAAADPYALFGAHDSDGYYHRIKVYSDGAYTADGFSVSS